MKVVILAGGYGTRLAEETITKPKPMVEIGGMPILWHIMKIYYSYGYKEFIICLGYKGNVIKDFFTKYQFLYSDVTYDFTEDSYQMDFHNGKTEKWKVTLVNTGSNSMTGGRLGRVKSYVQEEPFMMTYGDGLSDVNIPELIEFHKNSGKFATITAVQPEGRFGVLQISEDQSINQFTEKPKGEVGWINGGFFVLDPKVFDYITGDSCVFETDVLPKLANDNQLMAYHHQGFWKPMDTLNDRNKLEEIWNKGNAPWKTWNSYD